MVEMSAGGAANERMTEDQDVTVTVVEAPLHVLDPADEAPRFLGRYVVIDELGTGGMGRVFRAYDPELDREVALKLLRDVNHDARARLLREAQAMAKLSHPNVLPVYDVAVEGHLMFLAMEIVHGQSLRTWLDASPRTWAEVLAVLLAAGRGLAAAHAAGLVHRDFKPGNVLIGDDGRVRVTDFGLARRATSESGSLGDGRRRSDVFPERMPVPERMHEITSPQPTSETYEPLGSLGEELTHVGALLGTLAYMAPEQHLGHADHRSDQYEFCVTLWEALYGRRPFTAEKLDDWHRVKSTTRPRADPERSVPRWLHAVVSRGLAPRPGDRWVTMDALLHALTRARRRRRRLRVALAMGGALALATTAAAALHDAAVGPSMCSGARDKLAGIWDEATADAVEQAVLATALAYAPDTWDRLAPRLDGYATRWEAAHADACEATFVRHEQPEGLMDARMRCLDERRRSLRALVGALREADARVVERAVVAAGALPAIEPCADPQYVQAQAPPPGDPALAAEVEALEDELARHKALVEAGRAVQVQVDARAVLARAEALGHAPLEVQARFQLASLEEVLGHYEAAGHQLEQTYFSAQREGLDSLQARAAIELIEVHDAHLGQPDVGEQWERFARVMLQRVHDPALEAAYLNNAGVLASNRDEFDTAVARLARALELYEQLLGAEHPVVANVINNLANLHEEQGRYDEALALHERALAIRERAFGPEHPSVATSLLNASTVQRSRAHYDEALALLRRAHAIYERAYGPDHPHAAVALVNLGAIHETLGRPQQALELYTDALTRLERSQGAHHPHVATTLDNIGTVYKALGDPVRAREHYERALQILERTLGPRSFDLSISLTNLGGLAQELGDHEQAAAHLDRALEIVEATVGPRHPVAAAIHTNRALVHLARGEHAQALQLLQQALELHRELLGPRHPQTAGSLGQLGEAFLAAGRPAEAIEPLEQALEILAEHEDQAEPQKHAQRLLDDARAQVAFQLSGGEQQQVALARKAER
jgi:eukaryotic-like serine/threonine-protein kinase